MKIVPRHPAISKIQRSTQTGTWLRSFSRVTNIRTMASKAKAKFSEGSDEVSLSKQLDNLASTRWIVTHDGQGIERSFKFKTFAKTWVRPDPLISRGWLISRELTSARTS